MENTYNVKAVKYSAGHDGDCMQCNLYIGKKKIASVWDDSYGGGFQYSDRNEKEFKIFLAHVRNQPQWESEFTDDKKFDMTDDIYVSNLITQFEKEKEEKRRIKLYEKAIVVLTKGQEDYVYYKLPQPVKLMDKKELSKWVNHISKNILKANQYIANTNLSEFVTA